jgi:hypothetical protein
MALVEKTHGWPWAVFPIGSEIPTSGQILKALAFLTAYALTLFTLGFAFGHGHWVIALWCVAAGIAWLFMRGASEASLLSERYRDE